MKSIFKDRNQLVDLHLGFPVPRLVLLVVAFVNADDHEVLSNFVCVLARSRYFDWASPVKVEVAQGVCQLLDVSL